MGIPLIAMGVVSIYIGMRKMPSMVFLILGTSILGIEIILQFNYALGLVLTTVGVEIMIIGMFKGNKTMRGAIERCMEFFL